MYTIDRLEKKYGIKVEKDFVSAISGKQLYKMYSADGCHWESGLSLKGLREECEEWGKLLLEIKQRADERKARAAERRTKMNNKVLEKLKRWYPKGTRVELVYMDDPQAPPIGTTGTVTCVDDIGTIHVSWDTGGSLGIAYGVDKCRILN
jgi:hypothetical protein